jgi:hypothetical protein
LNALAPKEMKNHFDVDATLFNALGFLRYTKAENGWGGFGFQVFLDGRYEGIAAGKTWDRAGMLISETSLIARLANTWEHLRTLESRFGIAPFLVGVSAWNLSLAYFGAARGSQVFQCKEDNNRPVICNEVRFDALPETAMDFGRSIETSLLPLFTAFGRGKVDLSMDHEHWNS